MKVWPIAVVLFSLFALAAKPPVHVNLNKKPQRTVRECCIFGAKDRAVIASFIKISQVSAPDLLGNHVFMGGKGEKSGIIYTHKAGFIDIGHLRDIADVTSYIYTLLKESGDNQEHHFDLGKEAGQKVISFRIPKDFKDTDRALLAGRIAYEISIWHEIATWYGSSTFPFIRERNSSFSMEDAYSNLLGTFLAREAILGTASYDDEMTRLIRQMLLSNKAVQTVEDTKNAMMEVEGKWWTERARLPSKRLLLTREFNILDTLTAWTLPQDSLYRKETRLVVPQKTSDGTPLTSYFDFKVYINSIIPSRSIFGEKRVFITQKDFPGLIAYAQDTGKFK